MNKVVVTGMGVISSLANDADIFYRKLVEGKNGISAIEGFDTSGYKVSLAAEIKTFNPDDYFDRKEARRMDRYCQFAVAAALKAVEKSGIDFPAMDPYRCGVIVGSGTGGMATYEAEHTKFMEKGPNRVSPLFVPMMISNMAAGMISMKFGLKGANYCPVTACASASHAIGEAFRLVKHGYLDAVVTGGAEASITPFAVAGFSNMTALSCSDDPNAASLPFDKRRSGFVMGEGAGILIIESEASAKARGARIYAEIAGYGATADAYHITSPDPDGISAAQAMANAMNEGGISPSEVDYINAHGTGTELNDKYETLAIKNALGAAAYNTNISSTKSMTGHLLGAAGAIEAIACIQTINNGKIPPTINFREKDEELDLNYTFNAAAEKDVKIALSNSLGFGGHNATLAFRRY